ncbi:hypothetical protein CONLIGDRAFT_688047 [Coniochaeta ligniaria NRRL 30616]|uniref:Uncharacterized protein n=1 Tax=Coniochaeta ligniaria NRRL 30616 TaxID=1408157 RepID=A0A1J7K2B7_9PEZI|nr:hypothetical protein CONLIGDRAFT_688047 [Coniochaeta ligniaria NRRL 30616]
MPRICSQGSRHDLIEASRYFYAPWSLVQVQLLCDTSWKHLSPLFNRQSPSFRIYLHSLFDYSDYILSYLEIKSTQATIPNLASLVLSCTPSNHSALPSLAFLELFGMPFSNKNAPSTIPEQETIEFLLGERNEFSKAARRVKPLRKLSKEERAETRLVSLGKRTPTIQGDPFGVWCSWAGNVGHGEDEPDLSILKIEIMTPLFEELLAAGIRDVEEVRSIHSLLEIIPSTPLAEIPDTLSVGKTCKVVRDTPEELVITFELAARTVRLMQCKDLDVRDEASYNRSARAKSSQQNTDAQLQEDAMTPEVTQYIMAQLLTSCLTRDDFSDFEYLEGLQDGNGTSPNAHKDNEAFSKLRMTAQEHFWLHMSPEQREDAKRASVKCQYDDDSLLKSQLAVIKHNWHDAWKSQKRYPDFFRSYVVDQRAAKNVWEHIEEDIVIVVDRNSQVVFANVERLAQLLFGEHITDVLERCLDMWSFFTPLPFPESTRHVVDNYIRKIHPQLDPSKATVETLPNAKMAVAHYGCWAAQGDPHGRYIKRTRDCVAFPRKCDNPPLLLPKFSRAALGKAAAMIRFLVKPLDQSYYKDCTDILANTDESVKLLTDDPEPFISLFAFGVNGYTQRHRDKNDVAGGGSLCIPQLNLKVAYQPGACALIRGTALEHLVADYSGPRFFLIGTNHESVKRCAWRKLGRLAPLAPKRRREETESDSSGSDDDEDVMETTCINDGGDEDDEIQYTNRELHGAGALNESSPSVSDRSEN